jgi:hypothetical protein
MVVQQPAGRDNVEMPGDVSGMVGQGGWRWGMARMCRGMRTVLWFLCLSDSLLSMMDIFCGVQIPANRMVVPAELSGPINTAVNI